MALKKTPVNGMKDVLPKEMAVRLYVQNVIRETYEAFGYVPINTPCMEPIENLTSNQGGENEKLIFKVLKRGEKLKLDEVKTEADLVDMGMRYDLTVPLCRYYANNANDLPMPFKAIQIGNVWRADRPQKGRLRQFMQCDIDVIGEPTVLAEIELILATSEALGKIGFQNFEIRINERRILKAMAQFCGFDEADYDKLFIILDKMDKLGVDGVKAELEKEGFERDAIAKYMALFDGVSSSEDGFDWLVEQLGDLLDGEVVDNMKEIFMAVDMSKLVKFNLVFDPTLVRGMSYYTGTIFEIKVPEFDTSCGGGGRYDGMVGAFTGNDIPACGFSIGFERIIMLLLESGFEVPDDKIKVAYLLEKGISPKLLSEAVSKAQAARYAGEQVLIAYMNKNKKFQKEKLTSEGYSIVEFYNRLDQKDIKGDLPWQKR